VEHSAVKRLQANVEGRAESLCRHFHYFHLLFGKRTAKTADYLGMSKRTPKYDRDVVHFLGCGRYGSQSAVVKRTGTGAPNSK